MKSRVQKFILLAALVVLPVVSAMGVDIVYGAKLPDNKGVFYSWESYRLNLRIENNFFRLYFLNGKNEVELAPEGIQASVRYESNRKAPAKKEGDPRRREENTVLLELDNDGVGLWSPRFINPPHIYWVTVTLVANLPGGKSVEQVFSRQRLNQITDNE